MSQLSDICEALQSVLCDPEGRACIHGSDGDLKVIDEALALLRTLAEQPQRERAVVAAKHQRKPRVTTAAELKQQAKSDTSCVGAFARARPGKA